MRGRAWKHTEGKTRSQEEFRALGQPCYPAQMLAESESWDQKGELLSRVKLQGKRKGNSRPPHPPPNSEQVPWVIEDEYSSQMPH